MPADREHGPTPGGVVFIFAVGLVIAIAGAEYAASHVLRSHAAHGAPLAQLAARYVELRNRALPWLPLVGFGGVAVAVALFRALSRLSVFINHERARKAGIELDEPGEMKLPRVAFDLRTALETNPAPDAQVVLGVTEEGAPVYLTDRARSMHVQVLGQTGSGKTKSAIEVMLYQDLRRGRGSFYLTGKGSEDEEERFLAIAKLAGRLDDVRLFTLNPKYQHVSHTYNVVHIGPKTDPRAVAERVFSSFEGDMDNPYYRDQAREFFVGLVQAFAGTGKPFSMLDIGAAIASPQLLEYALEQSDERAAKATLMAQRQKLGKDEPKTFTGLAAAVSRYNHPAVNAYQPDIVLEELLDAGEPVGFFLPVNMYKHLARYVGVCVLQHLQQVGALRQLDRTRSQTPVYAYLDEFYSFAYEGFTDSVNKLRDANVSFLLSHQSMSDLTKVSPDYAQGIYDNTRNKIVFFQNDPKVCESISKSIGTYKTVKPTAQKTVDWFGNSIYTLNQSSREVDEYRLHPNRIKNLACGQGYLVQDATVAGINFATIPDAVFAKLITPKLRRQRSTTAAGQGGLGLYDLFVRGQGRPA